MAKKGENIYLRKDGRWEGRAVKGRNQNGRIIFHSVYASKYSECKAKLASLKLFFTDTKHLNVYGNGSLSDFLAYYLSSVLSLRVKPSTYVNYVSIKSKWIDEYFKKSSITHINKAMMQEFVAYLVNNRLSAGYIQNIFQLLYSAMKQAAEDGYIQSNPCEKVPLPKTEKRRVSVLTRAEQKQIEQISIGKSEGLPIVLSLYTGLRVGELCALKWADLDLDNHVLEVKNTMIRIKNTNRADSNSPKTILMIQSAKTETSVRIIPLPDFIVSMLYEHKVNSKSTFVFSHKQGKHLEPRILQYRFRTLQKAAGAQVRNFHILRHTFATRCLENRVDVNTLSELLGHASAKMTLDYYGHSIIDHKRMAMNNLSSVFSLQTIVHPLIA